MKKIFLIIACCVVSITFSQSPIINLMDSALDLTDNYYVKDIDNVLNQFEGTYIYSTSGFTFKIILVKKVMQYNGEYYEDLLIGEYEYIDGFNNINTLNELNTVYNNQAKHNISSNFVIDKNYRRYPCLDCAINEKRLIASIKDVNTDRFADMVLRRTTNFAGQQILQVTIANFDNYSYNAMPFSLPSGTFLMIKQ